MNYIPRDIEGEVVELARDFPVITITGPRQAGKTTLARHLFPDLPYYNFESPDTRRFILNDPRRFLSGIPGGAVLDEFQQVPEIVSYLQEIVDERRESARFILTGSNHFSMMDQVSQSLAGRTALVKLLPFSLHELKGRIPGTTDQLLQKGFYPALYSGSPDPVKYYRNYYETYLQKDVRPLLQVRDLNLFDKFIRLCAGRTGNLLNLSSLANDTGLSVPTIRQWISVLEASYVLRLLPPYHDNISKRLIKSPKIYFYDPGLAVYLLGITNEEQMARDPLRGAVFETMIVAEITKILINSGLDPSMFFFRDSHHKEIDVVIKLADRLLPVEIKSSGTFNPDFQKNLDYFKGLFPGRVGERWLIYDGDLEQESDCRIMNYKSIPTRIPLS